MRLTISRSLARTFPPSARGEMELGRRRFPKPGYHESGVGKS
jgi:hypothetical protein